MTIIPMKSKSTGERFLKVDDQILPIGIAAMCADRRISNFRIKCTECREKYFVRFLNEGGYCDSCVEAEILSSEDYI